MNSPQTATQAPPAAEPVRQDAAAAATARQPFWQSALWALIAAGCFHIAYSSPALSFFILGYPFGLIQLARASSTRVAFYCGLGGGLLVGAPQLWFFWTIFGPGAFVLWLVLAFWIALFAAMARESVARFGAWACLLFPVLWTGLEYFRSELYYLKFSWLNIGYAFAGMPTFGVFHLLGMYGVGFGCVLVATLCSNICTPEVRRRILQGVLALLTLGVVLGAWTWLESEKSRAPHTLRVTGIQAEFPATFEIVQDLDKALQQHPDTDLFFLSEYTFDGPIPPEVTRWCATHQKYLIAGGKDSAPRNNFYDTAFIIGPGGNTVFKQVKSVPIQFFKDGLPAPEQKLWDSPWGKLGVCICYDLSYTRVTDRLVKMGARGILCPTMDVIDWGEHQHQLHSRVAPIRAAEYEIPIFRTASSGVSQFVDARGTIIAKAKFPVQHSILSGTMAVGRSGIRPLDRWLAPACVIGTALWILLLSRIAPSPLKLLGLRWHRADS